MPPIPIYTDAPLSSVTGRLPDGITPQTASSDTQHSQPTPTRTTAIPTGTSTSIDEPPPPQPGAVPYPPAQPAAGPPVPTGVPPAPIPGPTPRLPQVTATVVQTNTSQVPLPPQLQILAPELNAAATKSTSVATAPSHTQPLLPGISPFESGHTRSSSANSPADTERHSLEHPPGYMQNPYAADGTAAERVRLEDAARQEREQNGLAGTLRRVAGEVGGKVAGIEEKAWKWVGGKGV